MKTKPLILLSDVHLLSKDAPARLDNVAETALNKLQYVLDFAEIIKASIIQAGDLFDKPRDWYLLPQVMEMIKQSGVDVYSIYGQHDTYMYSENTRDATNLGILIKAGLVTLLSSTPVIISDSIALYGASYGQAIPEPDNKRYLYNVLVIHAPIAEESPYNTNEYMDAKKFLQGNKGYDLILCGDIHMSFNITMGKNRIVNTGPMIRKEGRAYNFTHKPHFYVLEGDKLTRHDIPHLPAEEVLTREHLDSKASISKIMGAFTDALKERKQITGLDIISNLTTFVQENRNEGINDNVISIISKTINKEI